MWEYNPSVYHRIANNVIGEIPHSLLPCFLSNSARKYEKAHYWNISRLGSYLSFPFSTPRLTINHMNDIS
jgi:hypothetical protein